MGTVAANRGGFALWIHDWESGAIRAGKLPDRADFARAGGGELGPQSNACESGVPGGAQCRFDKSAAKPDRNLSLRQRVRLCFGCAGVWRIWITGAPEPFQSSQLRSDGQGVARLGRWPAWIGKSALLLVLHAGHGAEFLAFEHQRLGGLRHCAMASAKAGRHLSRIAVGSRADAAADCLAE